MILDIEGIRPKVISKDLYKRLLGYKNFRHFFRHAYMNELEWHKMKELVDDYADTVDRFEKEIQAFIEEIRPAINV